MRLPRCDLSTVRALANELTHPPIVHDRLCGKCGISGDLRPLDGWEEGLSVLGFDEFNRGLGILLFEFHF